MLLAMVFAFHEAIPRTGALVLLAIFAVYIVYLIRFARKSKSETNEDNGVPEVDDVKPRPFALVIALVILGAGFVIAGGQAIVWSATRIASSMGITERVIGLTVVAFGSSLPELVTGIVAGRKGHNEMIIGNILGSSIINLLFVLGVAGLITPLTANYDVVVDIAVLLVAAFAFYIFAVWGRRISRVEGLVLVMIYGAFMVYLFVA